MAQGSLRVRFAITEKDVFNLQVYHSLHDRALQCALLIGALIFFGGGTYLFSAVEGEGLVTSLVGGLVAVLLFAGVYLLRMSQRAAQWGRKGGPTKQQTVEISPEGVLWSVESDQASMKWAEIQQVEGIPDYLCLFVGKRAVNLIPRRSFGSAEAADDFLQAARGWHLAARAQSRGASPDPP